MSPTATATSRGINSITATPEQVEQILLADGWHRVSNVQQVQFAISQGMSEPVPDRYFTSISYTDESGKQCITTFDKVQAWSLKDSYKNF